MAGQNRSGIRRRQRRNAAEGRALVARYRGSGESIAGFCGRTGVGPHVLRYWLGREEEAQTKSSEFFVLSTPASKGSGRWEGDEATPDVRSDACIVVVRDASSLMLARTVRELLTEARS